MTARPGTNALRQIIAVKRVLWDAFGHFDSDDGWAMASHLAITALMTLFPFLIFATSLAGFLGAHAFADTAVHLVFDTWPEQIAEPIARQVVSVLTVKRGGFLTLSVIAAAFFASNGIEALRVALNRAYRVSETRSLIVRRLQSFAFVFIATLGFLAISVLLVIAPIAAHIAERRLDWIQPYIGTITIWRYIIASVLIIFGLVAVHFWLPGGSRRFIEILPGILFTLIGWIVGSAIFAAYLERFSTYVTTYAGLASIMSAIVFLYIISVIFIMGGELNAAIARFLAARSRIVS